jgi:polysaccharide export outer membrane protein
MIQIAKTLFLLLSLSISLCTPVAAQPSDAEDTGSGQQTNLRYPLQPFDSISISVFNHPELSATQRISDVGTIALPLVGEVKVAGLTTAEAQRSIATAYIEQEYLVKPIVTVHINSFTPQTVTILGELNGPGQVVFPDGVQEMPIQEVVAKAGDFSGIAKSTEVRIERKIPGHERPKIFIIDVEKIIESTRNNEAVDTFMIRPGDIIFVPRRAF